MKTFGKILLSALAAVLTLSVGLTACKKGEDGEPIDPTRTQIYVGMNDGGFGTAWFTTIKEAFEKEYRNKSFQKGRTGVQVMMNKSVSAYMTDHLVTSIGNIKQELVITESGADFYYEFVNGKKALDITDVVTQYDLSKFGDTGTIEQKLPQSFIDYYKTDEGKYYALPNNEATVGIVYDIDVWEEELLYFAEKQDAAHPGGFIVDLAEDRSTGPDGEYGTYDDGLPATFEEFYRVCRRLKDAAYDPILWYFPYVATMLSSMHADFDPEQLMDNYDFDSEGADLVKPQSLRRTVDPDGNVRYDFETENKAIAAENGYDAFRQPGRLYALEFIETLVENGYASSRNFNESHTHLTIQDQFLYGAASSKVKQAAMLVEGSWWENEASGTFDDMARDYTDKFAKKNRRFGFMPFPKPRQEQVDAKDGYTMLQTNRTMMLINAKTEPWKVPLVKDLMAFINTNDMLAAYTRVTNTTKPLKYTLTKEELSGMTNFGRELYALHNDAQTVFPLSKTPLFQYNTNDFAPGTNSFYTKTNDGEFNQPGMDIKREGISAGDWFNGLYTYRKGEWNTYLNRVPKN